MCNSIDMHSLIRQEYWCVITKLKHASKYPFILYFYNSDALYFQFVILNCTHEIRKSIEIPHKITYDIIVLYSLNRNLYLCTQKITNNSIGMHSLNVH